jgi:hypothetical protein
MAYGGLLTDMVFDFKWNEMKWFKIIYDFPNAKYGPLKWIDSIPN